MDVLRSGGGGGVEEAAPVPDLLGSILSGQSMLLMDSSDVIINRDGSLKAVKTMVPSAVEPSTSKSSSSRDADVQINPGMSPNRGDGSLSLHYNLLGSSHNSANRLLSQSTACLPSFTSFSVIHNHPPPYSCLPPRGHPRLQPLHPSRPFSFGHHGTNTVGAPREVSSSIIHNVPDSNSKSKGTSPPQTQSKKAPTKPMWVDVSVLPRIPKIKRESSSVTDGGTSQDGINRTSGSMGNSSDSTCRNNGYGMPKMGMNNLAGEKSRQQSVDQQKGKVDGQPLRHRSGGASSSAAFSNSFSSSSSSTDSPAGQSHYSSSSSSAVSFRINSSGNTWHSRRLNIASSSASAGSMQEHWRKREDEARKRQLHRDKQMLLASRTPVKKEQDGKNMYDPFNPTVSNSSSSDEETESSSQNMCFQQDTHESKGRSLGNEEALFKNKLDRISVKMEMQETEVSQEHLRRASSLETISQEVRCSEEFVKVEKESIFVETKIEKQPPLDAIIKKESGLDDTGEVERCGHIAKMYSNSERPHASLPAHHSLGLLKTEEYNQIQEHVQNEVRHIRSTPTYMSDSSASSSAATKKKEMAESKPVSTSSSKSPSRDFSQKKKTSKASKEQHSSGSEMDRARRGVHHTSDHGSRQKEKDKDKEQSSRRSRSKERRRERSASQSSVSNSPGRSRKKWCRSRSRSKDRKRSRSGSRSSSREYSRKKKLKQRSDEKKDSRERDDKKAHTSKDERRGRSRSKSRSRSRSTSRSKDVKRDWSCSKSRSRSRSKERRKDHTWLQKPSPSHRDKVGSQSKDRQRYRSRANSRERKKEGSSSKCSQKTCSHVLSSENKMQQQDKKKKKDSSQSSVKEENIAKGNKHEIIAHTSTPKVKKEDKDLRSDDKPTTAEMTREVKVEIKKEKKSSLHIFEDSPNNKSVKKELDMCFLPENRELDEKEIKEEPMKTQMCQIKTETCEIIIKSEPSSPKLSHLSTFTSFSTLPTPVTSDCLQVATSKSHSGLMALVEQPSSAGITVPVKQEVLQPSDSDDDFHVDVMLDNLDYVKTESTEGAGTFVKQEKEVEEGKNEREQALVVVGAKSKTQVKRVTWNIQEPEVLQPEKSASKVALYKLKRRQEGARRPSSMVHTSSQDITGAVNDSSKKVTVVPLNTPSKSDDLHPEWLSVAQQGEEGDMSIKDKYLKKLHMQERAIEEVKLAIKPFYQRRDINKDEYKDILRKAVQKVCHSKSGEINPVKVGNLVKAYVDKYKHARKYKKFEESEKAAEVHTEAMKMSNSP